MKRTVKQEICPVCAVPVDRRHAVVHYRAHVRRGDLIGGCLVGDRHTRFRLPGTTTWWRRGQPVHMGGDEAV